MDGLLFLTDLDALILIYKVFNSAINGFFPLEMNIEIKMYLDIKMYTINTILTLQKGNKNIIYNIFLHFEENLILKLSRMKLLRMRHILPPPKYFMRHTKSNR